MEIGHLRQQGPSRFGGTLKSPGAGPGADFDGPTVREAQMAAISVAEKLGWRTPFRWDGPDEAGGYLVSAAPPPT